MEIKAKQEGNTVAITLSGDFDAHARTSFRNAFKDTPGSASFVLDFDQVQSIDSAGIGMLLMLREHAGTADADITIRNCTPMVRQTMQVAQMNLLFKIV